MKAVILSLGGSLIIPSNHFVEGDIDVAFLKKFRALVRKHSKDTRFFIITGGGKTCRKYQAAAKKLVPLTKEELDWIGIHVTRLNAHFVRFLFKGLSWKQIIGNPEKRIILGSKDKVVVGAGWEPGWSTDYDAVQLAKTYGVKTIINLTDIDYAYSKDPRKFKDAKRLTRISWKDFFKIVGKAWRPGMSAPFDPIASRQAAKAGIRVIITNGRDLKNLELHLLGRKAKGTIVE